MTVYNFHRQQTAPLLCIINYFHCFESLDDVNATEPELAIEDTDSNAPLDELKVNLTIKSDVMASENSSPGLEKLACTCPL